MFAHAKLLAQFEVWRVAFAFDPKRQAAQQTQEQLAVSSGVGQDTISRLEKRSDMLLSTLRHYVESMGGELNLVAQFPNRPPVVIEHLGVRQTAAPSKSRPRRARVAA